MTTELLLIGVFENDFLSGTVLRLNERTEDLFSEQAQTEKFTGAKGETMVSFTNIIIAARRVLLYGLGARENFDVSALRVALTAAFKKARALKVEELTVDAFALEGTGITQQQFGEMVALYFGLVTYDLNHFKTVKGGLKPEATLCQLRLAAGDKDPRALRRGLEAGKIMADCQNRARDQVNLPSTICTPSHMALQASALGQRSNGRVHVEVYGKRWCSKNGLEAFLAVNKGSDQDPMFIVLKYFPENAVPNKVLGLVGKAITFDSGGLDIKTADGMLTMKCDMAGGATVLSAMEAIAMLELPINVIAVLAATDNMLNSNAYRPGDVVNTLSGRTIEINNTDAEGRVTLADAIHYIRTKGATHVIDIATLTGAMISTTADVGAGLFGNNAEFNQKVLAASTTAGEYLWPMPMWSELKAANETPMADLSNVGAKIGGAGASTAALFIAEFAEQTPWVHLDVAGTAYRKREFQADPVGGTGWGMRTLVSLARSMAR